MPRPGRPPTGGRGREPAHQHRHRRHARRRPGRRVSTRPDAASRPVKVGGDGDLTVPHMIGGVPEDVGTYPCRPSALFEHSWLIEFNPFANLW